MIIGITGTNGAGKGTVVDYLKQKGFKHYSASGFIAEEVKKRGLPINRDTLNEVGTDLRRTHHPTYIMQTLYDRARVDGGNAIIESVRGVAGAQMLKEEGAVLLAVDADRQVRYERVVKRGSEKDHVSFERFCEQEDRELEQNEEFAMNINGVMRIVDYTLKNNGTLEELHAQIDDVLKQITK